MKRTHTTENIRNFILENLEDHSSTIIPLVAGTFGITRQSAHQHIKKLLEERIIESKGNTKNTTYHFRILFEEEFLIKLEVGLAEDKIWREKINPILQPLKLNENVAAICQYGFTEMFNNVIDHSEADSCVVNVAYHCRKIKMDIQDNGVGIFEKIKRDCGLEDQKHALLELAKGKLTADPDHHTGEGIFFTSRVFDKFSILSGELFYTRFDDDDEGWLLEDAKNPIRGTAIFLSIDNFSKRTLKQVFDKYANEDIGFSKTYVPVKLAIYGQENLVSRSQAKRLLAHFDKFQEVFLDFEGVPMVGQAFADEIFRVFKSAHPEIKIVHVHANDNVRNVIQAVVNKERS